MVWLKFFGKDIRPFLIDKSIPSQGVDFENEWNIKR